MNPGMCALEPKYKHKPDISIKIPAICEANASGENGENSLAKKYDVTIAAENTAKITGENTRPHFDL
jgi:hypothetical protein